MYILCITSDLFHVISGAAIVDALTTKVAAWEKERGIEFTYDGVSLLLPMETLISNTNLI